MSYLKWIAILLGVSIWLSPVVANPIIPAYLSELIFTPSGWVLEMDYPASSLDGWSISSRSGTAQFKQGITLDHRYFLVTADSLLTPLSVNAAGDSVAVRDPHGFAIRLIFGPGQGATVQAPSSGWSLSFHQSEGFFYLDSSPTPGEQNDSFGAMATITGIVRDSATRNPIANALVVASGEEHATADGEGRFSLQVYSRDLIVNVGHAGYSSPYLGFSLVPGQVVDTTILLSRLDAVAGYEHAHTSLQIRNYPNPFNPSTTLEYTLPSAGDVRITLYDLSGREVANPIMGGRPEGRFRVTWNGNDEDGNPLSSGLYFARIDFKDRLGDARHTRVIKILLLR